MILSIADSSGFGVSDESVGVGNEDSREALSGVHICGCSGGFRFAVLDASALPCLAPTFGNRSVAVKGGLSECAASLASSDFDSVLRRVFGIPGRRVVLTGDKSRLPPLRTLAGRVSTRQIQAQMVVRILLDIVPK